MPGGVEGGFTIPLSDFLYDEAAELIREIYPHIE